MLTLLQHFKKKFLLEQERERDSRKVESAFLDYFYCDLFKGYKKQEKCTIKRILLIGFQSLVKTNLGSNVTFNKTNHLDRSYLLIVGRCTTNLMLLKWDIPGLFLFIFVFLIQLTVKMFHIKVCQCQDSNHGTLVSEATALPTEPQPLP